MSLDPNFVPTLCGAAKTVIVSLFAVLLAALWLRGFARGLHAPQRRNPQ